MSEKPPELSVVLEYEGFEPCKGFEAEPCEICKATGVPLFFGDRDYWDDREGTYLCETCVRFRYGFDRAAMDFIDEKTGE